MNKLNITRRWVLGAIATTSVIKLFPLFSMKKSTLQLPTPSNKGALFFQSIEKPEFVHGFWRYNLGPIPNLQGSFPRAPRAKTKLKLK
jgi:hypothetical protein